MESALPPEIWLHILDHLDTVSFVRLFSTGIIPWTLHDASFRSKYNDRKNAYVAQKFTGRLRTVGNAIGSAIGGRGGLQLEGFGDVMASKADLFCVLFRELEATYLRGE